MLLSLITPQTALRHSQSDGVSGTVQLAVPACSTAGAPSWAHVLPVCLRSCATCGLLYVACPGHFGHVELPVPVYNPLVFMCAHTDPTLM